MLVKIFLILLSAYLSFEIIEHLVVPLIGRIFWKGKRRLTGPEGMIGKSGRVREWQGNAGKVDLQAEIWNAECDVSLVPGDRVVVEGIKGLTLKVRKS
jgi:membrane-bound serine protease (ClpP class)